MTDNTSTEPDGGLPAGFYEQLRAQLMLVHIACHHAFQYPETALTQEAAALTNLDAEFVDTMHAVHDNATLAEVMQQQPVPFLWYLRLGQQLLTSTLGQQIFDYLQARREPDTIAPDAAAKVLEHFLHGLHILLEHFTIYLTQHDESLAETLELGALQLQGIVVRQLATLPPLQPATPPLAPSPESEEEELEEEDWEEEEIAGDELEEVAARLRFQEGQLQVMRLATTLPAVITEVMDGAFARGVAAIEAFQTPKLRRLRERLERAQPEESLEFTLTELALLFRGVQVCGMVMLLPDFEDLLLSVADNSVKVDEETGSQIRHIMAIIVAGFVELMQEEYGEEPEFARAQKEMEVLADLL